MEYKVNNAEFVLLTLLAEEAGCNGYALRSLVQQRGYDAWAGVSASSIYVTLKKLEHRNLVASQLDGAKTSKGPTGRIFNLNQNGKEVLKREIKATLSKSREHDPRFNIALSGIDFLDRASVQTCLAERQKFLKEQLTELELMAGADQLPLSAKLIFGHIIAGLKAEIDWQRRAYKQLN